jgi:hypothetical protein
VAFNFTGRLGGFFRVAIVFSFTTGGKRQRANERDGKEVLLVFGFHGRVLDCG